MTGHDRLPPEKIAAYRSMPLLKVGKQIGVSLHQVPRLLIKGRALMRERMQEVKVFPGIHEALDELHRNGWRLMVISSNSPQNVESYLKSHGLLKNFDRVYGNIGLFGKASALRKVTKQNRLDRSKCFYVGDEIRDIQAARKVSIKGIAVTWGYNDVSILEAEKPFAIAENPDELVRIFSNNKDD
jgi:HAD superfamily hydrolase (TIGR01549 family)